MEAPAKSPRLRLGLFISFEPLEPRRHPLKNPDHDARRTVIREWMKLPTDKRRSKEQAQSFATQAAERHAPKSPGYSSERIIG